MRDVEAPEVGPSSDPIEIWTWPYGVDNRRTYRTDPDIIMTGSGGIRRFRGFSETVANPLKRIHHQSIADVGIIICSLEPVDSNRLEEM
jgi:hypothetical protein